MDEGSLEIVDAAQMYPRQSFTSDDGVTTIPFSLLSGENPLFRGKTADGILILTSYRLYHTERSCINIPLGLIDYIECKEIVYLYIYSKDGRSFRCLFSNNEETQKWLRRIQDCIKLPDKIDHSFAFRFLSWAREEQKEDIVAQSRFNLGTLLESKDSPLEDFTSEVERMGFDLKSVWKITKVNEEYKLCPSYPRYMVVPNSILDENMKDLATFRYSKRIPAVVWRHQQNGCVIARSSQPKMGILSWRNANDEKLIDAIYLACHKDQGFPVTNGEDAQNGGQGDSDVSVVSGQANEETADKKPDKKKLLIVDARSFTAAMTNRAKGGGYESDGYYQNCEVEYMGLANIHAIRNSFLSLRSLCAVDDDQNWLSSLESTKWLLYISGLLRSALVVVDAVDIDKRPVLVHCSDGWDRTPQIVALAEIMLDPYYRTKKGFQVLVEREWLEFGHKFADRCGHSDGTEDRNERSPVFLQWLDCIFQLLRQFQCHFEFNEQYLARLILHTYSCLFGTFLCNTDEDRCKNSVSLRTFSVWPVLNEKSQFHNYLYNHSTEVLRPSYQIRSLKFWGDVYLANSSISLGKPANPPAEESLPVANEERSTTNLVKTKSCDNISSAEHTETLKRRKSDTNLAENSFAETVRYPQIPSFAEDAVSLPNPPTDPTVSHVLTVNGDIENNPATRTDFNSLDIPTKSNLILRESNIDGSTDTLVSESGAITQEHCGDDTSNVPSDVLSNSRLVCSIGTDTSDLVIGEDIQLPQNHVVDNGVSTWCQTGMGAYYGNKKNDNSCSSCSYTTPNHSRTPSSGFPSTPCDDSSEMPNSKRDSPACQIMDFDGLNLLPDAVQDRIKKLIRHYKGKVSILNLELSAARCERYMCRQYRGKENNSVDGDDAPSLADSASSGEHHAESGGSESSWDLLYSPDHGIANLGMGI